MQNLGFGPSHVINSLPAQYVQPRRPRVLQAGFGFGGPTMPDIQLHDVPHRPFQARATSTAINAPRLHPQSKGFGKGPRAFRSGGCGCG